ncbi:uncharacterized protein [Rutidosis leptorrhynchoides]|uniref:uncharacterized protein n=1 Tax=Rutidosis leptorrhynchoides TaxID=125765 RepID=UPI003A9A34D4
METSILTPTHKYAASGLFALALHQSQIHQTRPSDSLVSLDEERIPLTIGVGKNISVSDEPQLWIHENSGLLLPVFRLLGVDDHAWDGLKETAGSSSQVRHHVGAFLTMLSEENEKANSETTSKELALTKTVDAALQTIESSPRTAEHIAEIHECEAKCRDDQCVKGRPISDSGMERRELRRRTSFKGTAEEDPKGSAPLPSEKPVDEGNMLNYQRKVTVLYELISACLADNIAEDNKPCQARKGYDARHRVALHMLATWLGIKWIEMEAMEMVAACSIMATLKNVDVKEKDRDISEGTMDKVKRGGMIGAAALTGGAVMAITGGLAAPAIAQGLGALAPGLGTLFPIIGASGFLAAAGATGSLAGSVAVAASFGAAGASLTGAKMARRIGAIEEFEFKEIGQNQNQGRLAVGIFVSGIVFEIDDYTKPWENYDGNLERYAILWESENLIALSTAIEHLIASKIVGELMKEGAMFTVLSTLVMALSLPATLLTATDLIDTKWAIAVDRSDKAGKLLAEVLQRGLHGNRPVTLIGFSLGARVIFKCLECLAESAENAGLVEKVVLLGAPVPIKGENWEGARKMVAGRFFNGYSTNDWTLGITYRASLFTQGLSGIQPVEVPGIENLNVTEFVEGHSSYLHKAKEILQQLDLETCSPVDLETFSPTSKSKKE